MPTHSVVENIVVGSGAGGSVTAHELASRGREVLIIEEGDRLDTAAYGTGSAEAMRKMYRSRGMTPIVGNAPVGYVEGCVYGGSTEINSGFWHRAPREILLRWKAQFGLLDALAADLEEHFEWAEEKVSVSMHGRWPASTRVFARGLDRMNWSYGEVPRCADNCEGLNCCASGCPTGAKRSMSRTLLPEAEKAGARVLTGCRVKLLIRRGGRVSGLLAVLRNEAGDEELIRIDAENIFVCAGPTETPALLRRSGITFHVGDSFRIHPMLKVVARFDERIDAHNDVLPLVQVKEFSPDICLGGAFITPGHLALTLSENREIDEGLAEDFDRMASYYVAVRGTGRGSIRSSLVSEDRAQIRYHIYDSDLANLSRGLSYLSMALLAGGATEVFPSAYGIGSIRSELEAVRWLDQNLPVGSLALTTVHAFCACPIGEDRTRCAADSYGRLYGLENLYVNDASMIPDSPGVNPQGTVMALARRNVLHFLGEER